MLCVLESISVFQEPSVLSPAPARIFTPPSLSGLAHPHLVKTSLVAQMVRRQSTMWETRVQALGWEQDAQMASELFLFSSTPASHSGQGTLPNLICSGHYRRLPCAKNDSRLQGVVFEAPCDLGPPASRASFLTPSRFLAPSFATCGPLHVLVHLVEFCSPPPLAGPASAPLPHLCVCVSPSGQPSLPPKPGRSLSALP